MMDFVQRFTMGSIAAAFGAWAAAYLEKKRLDSVLRKVTARFLLQAVSSAFHGWLHAFIEAKKLKHMAERCVKKFINREMGGTLEVQFLCRNERHSSIENEDVSTEIVRFWQAWVEFVAYETTRRNNMTRFLERFMHQVRFQTQI